MVRSSPAERGRRGPTAARSRPGVLRQRVLPLLLLPVLVGPAACGSPELLPAFDLYEPVCDPGVVGVADSVLAHHSAAEVQAAVLATGWEAGEDEPTIVVVDRAPVLQNPAAVAEAMEASYPRTLRFHGISGTPRFALLVDPTGRVVDARLSGAAVLPEFDEAGAAVLGVMHFSPAFYQGCRPYYWAQMDLTFLVPPK